jgi:hypothetical protein
VPFDLGDTVRLTAQCTDPAGVPVTAATAVLTLTLPDGTTATPAVPAPVVAGQYTVDYLTTAAGRHAVRWVFGTPGCAYTDMFDVREAVPPLLFSLADAKDHLDIPAGDTTRDAALRGWIETVTRGIEGLVGACVRRTVTETHRLQPSGVNELALHTTPVLSLIGVERTDGGTAYDPAALDVDEQGILTRLDGGRLTGRLRITTQVGRAVIGSNIRDAALIILQHLWRVKMGGSRASGSIGGGEDYSVTEPVMGFGYAVPNRALQLLEPDRLPPGVG